MFTYKFSNHICSGLFANFYCFIASWTIEEFLFQSLPEATRQSKSCDTVFAILTNSLSLSIYVAANVHNIKNIIFVTFIV